MKIKILCLCLAAILANLAAGCVLKNDIDTSPDDNGQLSMPSPGKEQKNGQNSDGSPDDSKAGGVNVPEIENEGSLVENEEPVEADNKNQAYGEEELSETEEWMLLLVNPWNKLPDGFDVQMTKISGNHYIDSRAYEDYAKMIEDMRAEGLSPLVCSSYRTMEKQTTLYNNQIKKYTAQGYTQAGAEAEAGKWVAVPGTSEHHTGLALDIVASYYQLLDETQADTAEQKWLMENSYKYGFILRYPSDKSDLTGIYFEPWHYRYVGKKAAKEIYQSGICLEEYLALSH